MRRVLQPPEVGPGLHPPAEPVLHSLTWLPKPKREEGGRGGWHAAVATVAWPWCTAAVRPCQSLLVLFRNKSHIRSYFRNEMYMQLMQLVLLDNLFRSLSCLPLHPTFSEFVLNSESGDSFPSPHPLLPPGLSLPHRVSCIILGRTILTTSAFKVLLSPGIFLVKSQPKNDTNSHRGGRENFKNHGHVRTKFTLRGHLVRFSCMQIF